MRKKLAFAIPLALSLLVCAGCSRPSGGASADVGAEQAAPTEEITQSAEADAPPESEEADASPEAVSVDPKDYGITDAMLRFEEPPSVSELPLEALGAFFLHTDGAGAESSGDELYWRFMDAPEAVLDYMAKIDGDSAKTLCREIAYADVMWHDGTDEFAAILEEFPENAQSAEITVLLDALRSEREAALAQAAANAEAQAAFEEQAAQTPN